MTTELTTREQETALSAILAEVGQAANEAAAQAAFSDYRSRKAPNTLRRHGADLARFSRYLSETIGREAPTAEALGSNAEAWAGITWGLVDGFGKWMLLQGYAIATVNARLSTVKLYAKLAAKAGSLTAEALALIRTVSGYSRKEGKRIDEKREEAELPTRLGWKKAEPVSLTPDQAEALKTHEDTPQGRRDALLMCLLLDHGLRVGEVAGLTVANLDLKAGELRFYREKVDREQTHQLTPDTLAAARAYLQADAPALGPLLRASHRGEKAGAKLTHAGMTARAITQRVKVLGERLGIHRLSAHDCRHSWATRAARNGTPMDRLQDAGGWASLAMPARYIEAAAIANQGVKLSE